MGLNLVHTYPKALIRYYNDLFTQLVFLRLTASRPGTMPYSFLSPKLSQFLANSWDLKKKLPK